ncbi:MAG: hypothetical protein IPO92_12620, partial [Saprospiraceae bacterium]|nr:hypothetical protein [Saprospiraceae bacterium]
SALKVIGVGEVHRSLAGIPTFVSSTRILKSPSALLFDPIAIVKTVPGATHSTLTTAVVGSQGSPEATEAL